MEGILAAVRSPEAGVRIDGYTRLVEFINDSYPALAAHIDVLCEVTSRAIQHDEEQVALAALECWSSICDVENEILSGDLNVPCHGIATQAAQRIVPILLDTLTRQPRDQSEDEWNVAAAGATCLTLFANLLGAGILPLVQPFILSSFDSDSDDWIKEAGIMALGCCMESAAINALLNAEMVTRVLQCVTNPSAVLRDTSIWCLGRISELHEQYVTAEFIQVFVTSLQDEARVSKQACHALHACASSRSLHVTAIMQPLVRTVLQRSISVCDSEPSIRGLAFLIIEAIISNSSLGLEQSLVGEVLTASLTRLEHYLNEGQTKDLCVGVVHSCIVALPNPNPFAEAITTLACQVLREADSAEQETALILLGAVAGTIGSSQAKIQFADLALPLIVELMHNHINENIELVIVALSACGSVCSGLGEVIVARCETIAQFMLGLIPDTPTSGITTHILNAIQDLVLAAGEGFDPYIHQTITKLKSLTNLALIEGEQLYIERKNELLNSLMGTYTAILQASSANAKLTVLRPLIVEDAMLLEFLTQLSKDGTRDTEVTKALIGLIGDLAQAFGTSMIPFLLSDDVQALIEMVDPQNDDTTKDVLSFLKIQISDVMAREALSSYVKPATGGMRRER